jgi:hypothetical protein
MVESQQQWYWTVRPQQHWPAAPPFLDGKDPIRPVVVSGGRNCGLCIHADLLVFSFLAAQKGINQFGNFSEAFTAAPRGRVLRRCLENNQSPVVVVATTTTDDDDEESTKMSSSSSGMMMMMIMQIFLPGWSDKCWRTISITITC